MTENKKSTAVPSVSPDFPVPINIFQFLQQTCKVKTIIRTSDTKDKVLNMLKNGGIHHFDILSFVESNFSQDKNYDYAWVIHLKHTKHKNEMCCQLQKDPLVFPNSFK
jgi:hypothetical protein